MIRNDTASAAKEWTHEETFMTTALLKRRTEGNDAKKSVTLGKTHLANPWSYCLTGKHLVPSCNFALKRNIPYLSFTDLLQAASSSYCVMISSGAHLEVEHRRLEQRDLTTSGSCVSCPLSQASAGFPTPRSRRTQTSVNGRLG